jgi:hypothetical protein
MIPVDIPPAVDIAPGIYRHYKGKRYEVLGTARHSETFDVLVVYRALYENDLSQLWVRPVTLFTDEVEWEGKRVQRFVKV